MNEPQVGEFLTRIERMEGQLRMWKVVGVLAPLGVAAVVLAAVMVMGQTKSSNVLPRAEAQVGNVAKVLQAEKFVVVDADGKACGTFGALADGTRGLDLYGKDGKVRAGLRVTADGMAVVVILGRDGKVLAGLGAVPGGLNGMALSEENGKPLVGLGNLPDGSRGLCIYDAGGKPSVTLGVPAASRKLPTGLTISDRNDKMRVGLGVMADDRPTLYFSGRDGEPRAFLGMEPNGSAGLFLANQDGRLTFKAP